MFISLLWLDLNVVIDRIFVYLLRRRHVLSQEIKKYGCCLSDDETTTEEKVSSTSQVMQDEEEEERKLQAKRHSIQVQSMSSSFPSHNLLSF